MKNCTNRELATRLLAVLVLVFVAATQSGPAKASSSRNNALPKVLSDCLKNSPDESQASTCFGRILDNCLKRFPEEAVIPIACWEEELSAWNQFLDSNFGALISELESGKYAEFAKPIRDSQSHWLEQKKLDCKIEVTSTPQTYATTLPACQAKAMMKRAFFLQELLGADWRPLQE